MSRYFREERVKRLVARYAKFLLQRLPIAAKEELCDTILSEVFYDLAEDLLRNHARPHLLTAEEIATLARQRLNRA